MTWGNQWALDYEFLTNLLRDAEPVDDVATVIVAEFGKGERPSLTFKRIYGEDRA